MPDRITSTRSPVVGVIVEAAPRIDGVPPTDDTWNRAYLNVIESDLSPT